MKMNWGTSIAIFYISFMILMISAVVVTARKGVNLVRTDYYEKGLAVQEEIDAKSNILHLDDKLELTQNADEVVVKLPTTGIISSGTIHWYRPSDFHLDTKQKMSAASDGLLHIPTNELKKGSWVLKLFWTSGGKTYQVDRNVNLK